MGDPFAATALPSVDLTGTRNPGRCVRDVKPSFASILRILSLALGLGAFLISKGLQAQSPTETISGFGDVGTEWTFNAAPGGTVLPSVSGGTLTLIKDGEFGVAKSAWRTQQVSLNTAWVCRFRVTRTGPDSEFFADGFSFGFQKIGANYVGTGGDKLGFLNASGNAANNSAGVLFTIAKFGGADVRSRTGTASASSGGLLGAAPAENTGAVDLTQLHQPVDVVIQSAGSGAGVITVKLIQGQVVYERVMSLGDVLTGPLHLGFTGATGGLTETLQISDFFFGPVSSAVPIARGDYALVEGGTTTIDVLANDDPSTTGARLLVNSISVPRFGMATAEGDGKIRYQVTNSEEFPGEDWFSYDVMDSAGKVSTKAIVQVSAGLRAGNYVAAMALGSQAPAKHFLLKVTLSSTGALTGRLSRGGAKDVALRGAFDLLGTFRFVVGEEFNLTLDRHSAPGAISVFLGSRIRGGGAVRTVALRTVAPKVAGNYTGAISSSVGAQFGYGWHLGKVSANGTVKLAGQGIDGVPMTIGSQVNVLGIFPVHVPLYKAKGILTVAVELGLPEDTNAGQHFRPAGLGGAYDAGFDESVQFGSCLYEKPAADVSILGTSFGAIPTPVTFSVALPDVAGAINGTGTLQANQRMTGVTALAKFQFAGVKASGLFKGKFEHPTTKKILPFTGVAVQPFGAVGLIKTATTAGRISVGGTN